MTRAMAELHKPTSGKFGGTSLSGQLRWDLARVCSNALLGVCANAMTAHRHRFNMLVKARD